MFAVPKRPLGYFRPVQLAGGSEKVCTLVTAVRSPRRPWDGGYVWIADELWMETPSKRLAFFRFLGSLVAIEKTYTLL